MDSSLQESASRGFRYISWGCGLQSTTLVQMAIEGSIQCDAAIFADTQDEPWWVYETLWHWRKMDRPFPIYVPSKGSLADALRAHIERGDRVASIPAWTMGEDGRAAPLRRQCTREWKIEVIAREIRRILGYDPGERTTHDVRCLQGITLEECDRMSPNRYSWQTNEYPLIDVGMRAYDCVRFFAVRKLPVPRKSSCRYCPYHSDRYWREMKAKDPYEFERACQVDDLIRGMSERGVDSPVFIHRSLVPLRLASFGENQRDLFAEECTGYCGV